VVHSERYFLRLRATNYKIVKGRTVVGVYCTVYRVHGLK